MSKNKYKLCYECEEYEAQYHHGYAVCGTAVKLNGHYYCPYGGNGMAIFGYNFVCGGIKPIPNGIVKGDKQTSLFE